MRFSKGGRAASEHERRLSLPEPPFEVHVGHLEDDRRRGGSVGLLGGKSSATRASHPRWRDGALDRGLAGRLAPVSRIRRAGRRPRDRRASRFRGQPGEDMPRPREAEDGGHAVRPGNCRRGGDPKAAPSSRGMSSRSRNRSAGRGRERRVRERLDRRPLGRPSPERRRGCARAHMLVDEVEPSALRGDQGPCVTGRAGGRARAPSLRPRAAPASGELRSWRRRDGRAGARAAPTAALPGSRGAPRPGVQGSRVMGVSGAPETTPAAEAARRRVEGSCRLGGRRGRRFLARRPSRPRAGSGKPVDQAGIAEADLRFWGWS